MNNMRYNIPEQKTKLATAIKQACRKKGMSLTQVAEKAGISKSTLSSITSGQSLPYLNTLFEICNALDISVEELLDGGTDLQRGSARALNREEEVLLETYRNFSDEKRRWLMETIRLFA